MAPLNKYKDLLLQAISGVAYYQCGDLLLCYIPNLENFLNFNYFTQQCCGLVLHLILEKCVFFGFFHSWKMENSPNWPIFYHPTEHFSIEKKIIGIFCDEVSGDMYFSDGKSIFPTLAELLPELSGNTGKWEFTKLNFGQFFHILEFSEMDFYLIGIRSRLTYEFGSFEELVGEAQSAGLRVKQNIK